MTRLIDLSHPLDTAHTAVARESARGSDRARTRSLPREESGSGPFPESHATRT